LSLLEIILISIGLAMDCLAVSISCSVIKKEIKFWEALKIGLFFGFFQGIMPVIGWLLGISFKNYILAFDHWIAFGILGFIGLKMVIESFKKTDKKELEITSYWLILSLSIATSIDALMVGVSFAFLEVSILKTVVIIGGITLFISMVGFRMGKSLGSVFGRRAELVGGLVLIGIGTKILIEHLTA
jgi:manganese efflux pump family protein